MVQKVYVYTSWVDFHFTKGKRLLSRGHDTNISASGQWIREAESWSFELNKTVEPDTFTIKCHIWVVTWILRHNKIVMAS